jgi:hypothetical protein
MTTNIKLFENWIAEEEAAVAPAVTPTATTPVVKPAEYTAQNAIGNDKYIKVTISCIPPFDITKSTLTVDGLGLFAKINFNYSADSKTWKCKDDGAFKQAVAALSPITDKSKAKRSLAGIIFDALTLAGAPTTWNYNPNIAGSESSTTIDRLVAACGTNSFKGNIPADAAQIYLLSGIGNPVISSLDVTTEVNIDTLTPTGKFNIRVNNGAPSAFTGVDTAINQIVGSGSANSAVKQKITTVLNDLITKSKAAAIIPGP